MSLKHLNDLEKGLLQHKWKISNEVDGDCYSISAYWIIFNIKFNKTFKIVFEGLDDLKVLPIEKSYACYLENDQSISLYFSKNNNKEWKLNLLKFLSELDNFALNNLNVI